MNNQIRVEMTKNLVEVLATGKLTRESYMEFVPLVEQCIKEHGKVRMLFVMRDFHGWTAGALSEDVKFDLGHFRDIERLAIVGEKLWQKGMAVFCRPFLSAEIKYFDHTELAAAKQWLQQRERPLENASNSPAPDIVARLLVLLGSPDGTERRKARSELVAIGESVVNKVTAGVTSENRRVRWESTKTLAQIGGPKVASTLVERFLDDSDIRWIAAEGLRRMGRVGIDAVLRGLVLHVGSIAMCQGAHHVLHDVEDDAVHEAIVPVLLSLESAAPTTAAPVAALAAEKQLKTIDLEKP